MKEFHRLPIVSFVRIHQLLGLSCLVAFAGLATLSAEEGITSRDALGRLKAGNDRFVRNASVPVSLSNMTRAALVKQQTPFAAVLSCADSRIPPELIFNVGLGDLVVVRADGQVVDRSIMASLEHAVEQLHTPLLVVLGHESCAAVHAVVEGVRTDGPNADYVANAIKRGIKRTAAERVELRTAILGNVEQVINDALQGSDVLRRAVQTGSLQVVGGYYELTTGRVLFSEPIGTPTNSTPLVAAHH